MFRHKENNIFAKWEKSHNVYNDADTVDSSEWSTIDRIKEQACLN